MNANNLLELPRIRVKDLSNLVPQKKTMDNILYKNSVTCADIDRFVHNICMDISNTIGISYDEVNDILIQINQPFYIKKHRLFWSDISYSINSKEIKKLMKCFMIPDISRLKSIKENDKVAACFEIFKELSDLEKLNFLYKVVELTNKKQ